jgi:hypothetical protein
MTFGLKSERQAPMAVFARTAIGACFVSVFLLVLISYLESNIAKIRSFGFYQTSIVQISSIITKSPKTLPQGPVL